MAKNQTKKDDKSFMTKDGKIINTLKELAEIMSEISDDTFKAHVSDNKNEFAEWVGKIHKKEKLAEELMKSISKEHHKKIILRHITRDYQE